MLTKQQLIFGMYTKHEVAWQIKKMEIEFMYKLIYKMKKVKTYYVDIFFEIKTVSDLNYKN